MVTGQEMRQEILGIMAEILDCPATALIDQARLEEELGASSVARVELMVALERKFDVRLSHQEVVDASTVRDVVQLIASQTGS